MNHTPRPTPTRRHVAALMLAAVALALPAALIAGCTSDAGPLPALAYSDDGAYLPHQLAKGLVRDESSPIPDIPKPMRFVVVPSRSSNSFDGRARTVTHVYQGRAKLDDLRIFYLDQFNNHGWRPAPGYANDHLILAYVKGPEMVQLALSYAGGVSTVTVLIRPRGM